MKHVKMIFWGLVLGLMVSCGALVKEKTVESEETHETVSFVEPSQLDLKDKPVYSQGDCEGELGCLQGFISHGLELTISPEKGAETMQNQSGEDVELATFRFRDAQDFGDRFDVAFLHPLVAKESLGEYSFKVEPKVSRDNFAAGFELYSEGLTAQDDLVKMEGEGNFILGDLEPFDQVKMRAVKKFRITTTKAVNESDSIETVTCLEISTRIEDLEVRAGLATSIGGLRNFEFYYTEDNSYCQDVTGPGGAARTLPPVQPNLP